MVKDIEKYSQMIDEFAWYGEGNIFEIAKLAKRLNRNYMEDITERKKMVLNTKR